MGVAVVVAVEARVGLGFGSEFGLGLRLGKFGGKCVKLLKNVSLSFGSAPGRPPSGPPGCGMCSGAKVRAETHF